MSQQFTNADAVAVAPKPGVETSSYKILVKMIVGAVLIPVVPLLLAIIINRFPSLSPFSAAIEVYLTNVLVGVGGALGAFGLHAVSKAIVAYINQRGEVSQILAKGVAGIPNASTPAVPAQVETTTVTKTTTGTDPLVQGE